jgi:hypothetical protein
MIVTATKEYRKNEMIELRHRHGGLTHSVFKLFENTKGRVENTKLKAKKK